MILIFFKKNEDTIELRFSYKNSDSVDKNLGIFMICKIMTIPKNLSTENDILFSKLKYILIFIGIISYILSLIQGTYSFKGGLPLKDYSFVMIFCFDLDRSTSYLQTHIALLLLNF